MIRLQILIHHQFKVSGVGVEGKRCGCGRLRGDGNTCTGGRVHVQWPVTESMHIFSEECLHCYILTVVATVSYFNCS